MAIGRSFTPKGRDAEPQELSDPYALRILTAEELDDKIDRAIKKESPTLQYVILSDGTLHVWDRRPLTWQIQANAELQKNLTALESNGAQITGTGFLSFAASLGEVKLHIYPNLAQKGQPLDFDTRGPKNAKAERLKKPVIHALSSLLAVLPSGRGFKEFRDTYVEGEPDTYFRITHPVLPTSTGESTRRPA